MNDMLSRNVMPGKFYVNPRLVSMGKKDFPHCADYKKKAMWEIQVLFLTPGVKFLFPTLRFGAFYSLQYTPEFLTKKRLFGIKSECGKSQFHCQFYMMAKAWVSYIISVSRSLHSLTARLQQRRRWLELLW